MVRTQEGLEKVSDEAKGMVRVAKLKSEIRDKEKDIDALIKQLGAKAYQFHLEKKIGNMELRKIASSITKLKKDIKTNEKSIRSLKKQ